jgi:hypothetical protein
VFRCCPRDKASLFRFFIHWHPNASCERNVPFNSLGDALPIIAADGRAMIYLIDIALFAHGSPPSFAKVSHRHS